MSTPNASLSILKRSEKAVTALAISEMLRLNRGVTFPSGALTYNRDSSRARSWLLRASCRWLSSATVPAESFAVLSDRLSATFRQCSWRSSPTLTLCVPPHRTRPQTILLSQRSMRGRPIANVLKPNFLPVHAGHECDPSAMLLLAALASRDADGEI